MSTRIAIGSIAACGAVIAAGQFPVGAHPAGGSGADLCENAPLVGVSTLDACRVTRVHHIDGDLTDAQIAELCDQVLVNRDTTRS